MNMDTEISIKLPKFIEVDDYHKLGQLQSFYRKHIDSAIRVHEVGFSERKSMYLGLIHTNTDAHKKLLADLKAQLEKENNLA